MIRVDVYIPKWDYNVKCFFAVNEYWVDEIMEELFFLQIDGSNAKKAYENLSSGEINNGLCFANPSKKKAVIVVAKASDAAEFINSVSHENHHLASYVAKQFGLDPTGEDVAYFAGELMKEQFPYIKHLMCDCCKRKVYHERTHGEDHGYGVSKNGKLAYYYE
jgi:hypothetical protein